MLLRAQVMRPLLLRLPWHLLLVTLRRPCRPLGSQQLLLHQPGVGSLGVLLLPRHLLLLLRLLRPPVRAGV
jgi:hypothetical protein